MTEEAKTRKHAKAEYVVQFRIGDAQPWADTGIGKDCGDTAACVKAIRAEKKSGQYRIIAVKRVVTLTTETKTIARIE